MGFVHFQSCEFKLPTCTPAARYKFVDVAGAEQSSPEGSKFNLLEVSQAELKKKYVHHPPTSFVSYTKIMDSKL